MKPSQDLIQLLVENKLIPPETKNINNFPQLEDTITSHLSNKLENYPEVVFFDMEAIDDAQDYQRIASEFFVAASLQDELNKLNIHHESSSGKVCMEYKSGKTNIREEWIQESDWIQHNFINFIFTATKTKSGQFCELNTGDQFFLAVYMNNALFKAYSKYKQKSKSSREEFITGQSEEVRDQWGHIQILPRSEYARVANQFKKTFGIKDINGAAEDLISENSVVGCLVGDENRALECYQSVKCGSTEIKNYITLSRYDYGDICPEDECYFLSLDNPRQAVIFIEQSQEIGTLVDELEQEINDYLIVGINCDWGIFIKDRGTLAAFGTPVTELIKPYLHSIEGNQNAELAALFKEKYFLPTLSEMGYSSPDPSLEWNFLQKDHKTHWSAVFLKFKQENPEDDLTMTIEFGFDLSEISNIILEREKPQSRFFSQWKRLPRENAPQTWTLNYTDDYQAQFEAIRQWLRDQKEWLSTPPTMGEAADYHAGQQEHLCAAVAFAIAGQQSDALKHFEIAVVNAKNSGGWFEEKIQSIKKVAAKLGLTI
jgi:hypothetical protein